MKILSRKLYVCIIRNNFKFEKVSALSLYTASLYMFFHTFEPMQTFNVYIWSIWMSIISVYHIFVGFSSFNCIKKRIYLNFISGMIWLYNSLLFFYIPLHSNEVIALMFMIIQMMFSALSFSIFLILGLNKKIK